MNNHVICLLKDDGMITHFCMEQLHDEAGGDPTDDPAAWLSLEETRALLLCLEPLEDDGCGTVIRRIDDAGNHLTFASKAAALAYALWLSPETYAMLTALLNKRAEITAKLRERRESDE